MASVLLVDTNRASVPLYLALRRLGHRVAVAGSDPSAPLARLADHHLHFDYADPDRLSEEYRRGGFSHLVPGSTDASYLACAAIAGGRQPGLDPIEVVRELLDKSRACDLFRRLGIPHAARLTPEEAIGRARVVVKPERSFSGRGITVLAAPDPEAIGAALAHAAAAAPNAGVRIEEFLPGQLYSCSAFVRSGRVRRAVTVREDCVMHPFAVDLSMPATRLPRSIVDGVQEAIEALVRGLDLADGLVHVQFLVDGDRFSVVEITRRCPGDLYSVLARLTSGIPYEHDYVAPFFGVGGLGLTGVPDRLDRYLIRVTVSPETPMHLEALRFSRSDQLRLLVPLRAMGDSLEAGPSGRSAIALLRAGGRRAAERRYRGLRRGRLCEFESLDDGPMG